MSGSCELIAGSKRLKTSGCREDSLQSLQLTATAEDLPCKLGTSVELVWVTGADLHPLFRHLILDDMTIKKDFLTENVLDTLTLQLSVGPRHSIFTSIHCSKQASPGRGMLRCIQGSERVCVVIHPTAETCFHLNLKSEAMHHPRTTTCKQNVVMARAVAGVRGKIKLPHTNTEH